VSQTTFAVQTSGMGLYEITRDVTKWLRSTGAEQGLLTLFIRHTSASLLIQENADPEVQTDLNAFFCDDACVIVDPCGVGCHGLGHMAGHICGRTSRPCP